MKRKPSFKFTIKHLIMLLLVGSLLYYIVGLFTVREGARNMKPAVPVKKPAAA